MQRARRRPAILAIVILGTALVTPPILARDTDRSWEAGAYFQYITVDNSSGLEEAPGFGVRGGYHLKAIHELEIDFDSATADDQVIDGLEYDIQKYSFGYLRNFLVKGHDRVVPFAAFAIGIIDYDNGTEGDSSIFYRFGGGFKYYFTPRVGFRFDLKPYRWRGDGVVIPRSPFWTFDATAGVTFLLGGAS
jgi:hypothetical protein